MGKFFAGRFFTVLGLEIPGTLLVLVFSFLFSSCTSMCSSEVDPIAFFYSSIFFDLLIGAWISPGFGIFLVRDDDKGRKKPTKFTWDINGKGVRYHSAFVRLLPDLFLSLLLLAFLIFMFDGLHYVARTILCYAVVHWFAHWAWDALFYFPTERCKKCHCVLSYEKVKDYDWHSKSGKETQTHSGTETVGTVYDDHGNKVGDVTRSTTWTTTREYTLNTWKNLYRCRYCGDEKIVERSEKKYKN